MRTLDESIYDHPKYYDLVFNADVAAETKFIVGCGERYLDRPAGVYFEPACGTGRLIYALARRGHAIAGLDLNPRAVEFCNARLARHGIAPLAVVADMSDFSAASFGGLSGLGGMKRSRGLPPVDIAFNTINSFRHLTSETASQSHLRCMASVVRGGGVYLLGIHLTPTTEPPSETESWSARRGNLSINTHMWTVDRNRRSRLERFGIRFDVHTPTDSFRINDELRLRSYTPAQIQKLLDHDGQWRCLETFDFSYDLKHPIHVDSGTEDVVYVLQRQPSVL